MIEVLSYGGGRQTVALCLLILQGRVERPDRIVMADTGRENPMTFDYLRRHVQPALEQAGLCVEIAGHELATVDLYAHNGDPLLPLFTATGKWRGFCSGEWKRRVVERYLRKNGIKKARSWIGISLDEKRRARDESSRYPLIELGLTAADCLNIIEVAGWPQPHRSSCWMCPNKRDDEWLALKREAPEAWAQAVALDREIREADEQGSFYLHRERRPLDECKMDNAAPAEDRQCGLGLCFV